LKKGGQQSKAHEDRLSDTDNATQQIKRNQLGYSPTRDTFHVQAKSILLKR
jgi:hypothetical protein